MPESKSLCEHPLSPPPELSLDGRRRWLALACELDRLRVRRLLREASQVSKVGAVIRKVASVAPMMPGTMGKWVRGASLAAGVCRALFLAFRG